ncbi:hypothetical protein ACBJ59_54160 [Nonomuraea sp. MTCD27]|uniref:hypothetical protein n=1 Tax=Nonomuraea sp. MTCD27 TaxID=1676747 RepID=UPI0035C218FA
MRAFGHSTGRLFRGTDILFTAVVMIHSELDLVAADDDKFVLAGRFYFASHQGYQWYFFDEHVDGVFMYMEGESIAVKESRSFGGFAWKSLWREAVSPTTGLNDRN